MWEGRTIDNCKVQNTKDQVKNIHQSKVSDTYNVAVFRQGTKTYIQFIISKMLIVKEITFPDKFKP